MQKKDTHTVTTGSATILKRQSSLVYESGMTVFDEKLCHGRWLTLAAEPLVEKTGKRFIFGGVL